MHANKKRIAALCLLLVLAGGWAGLASRCTGLAQPARTVADPNSPRIDPSMSALSNMGLDDSVLFPRMMLAVGLVLGLGVVALFLSKRVLPRIAHPTGREIRVVETTCIGPRKALHLVEVAGQRLLIASTADRITMLTPIGETWLDLPKQQLDPAVEL